MSFPPRRHPPPERDGRQQPCRPSAETEPAQTTVLRPCMVAGGVRRSSCLDARTVSRSRNERVVVRTARLPSKRCTSAMCLICNAERIRSVRRGTRLCLVPPPKGAFGGFRCRARERETTSIATQRSLTRTVPAGANPVKATRERDLARSGGTPHPRAVRACLAAGSRGESRHPAARWRGCIGSGHSAGSAAPADGLAAGRRPSGRPRRSDYRAVTALEGGHPRAQERGWLSRGAGVDAASIS
jgi:hypothetical protein